MIVFDVAMWKKMSQSALSAGDLVTKIEVECAMHGVGAVIQTPEDWAIRAPDGKFTLPYFGREFFFAGKQES